jgi:hypothetical protein
MKITFMGILVVIGGLLLVTLVTYAVAQNFNDTGKKDKDSDEPRATT